MSDQPPQYPPMNPPPGQWGGVPQPGIIPFRPLDLGDLYGGAIAAIRRNPLALVGISFAAAAVSAVLVAVIQGAFLDDVGRLRADEYASIAPGRITEVLISTLVVVVISFIIGALASAVIPAVVHRAVLGEDTTPGAALALAMPKIWRILGLYVLIGLTYLLGILVVVGLALVSSSLGVIAGIALLVVVVYVTITLTFGTAALMIEDLSPVAAIRRSLALVKGSWWRVFGVMLLTLVIAGIVGSISALIIRPDGSAVTVVLSVLLTAVLSAFTQPFSSGVATLLYVDQRIRRER